MTDHSICACCVNHPIHWKTPWERYPYLPPLGLDLQEITFDAKGQSKNQALSEEEKEILALSSELWHRFLDLSNNLDDEVNECKVAIHNLQRIIATRVARRVDPDVWRNA